MSFHGASESDIAAALAALKKQLNTELGTSLRKLVLYGSRARGDNREDSDIDVAVIVDGMTREQKHTILEMVADIELEYLVPLSTLVMSAAEFDDLLKRERRIARDIEQEGKPL